MMKFAAAALVAATGVAAAQPATAFDFGSVAGSATFADTLASGEVAWFSVTLTGTETYLDINTNGSTPDTELGIFDAAGNFIATDDDDGIGLTSTLTFGTGSGLLLGDPFNLDSGVATGQDGALPGPGTYYFVVGGYNTAFGTTDFDVSPGSAAGDFTVTVYSNGVPTPATAALLGLGGLVATRRRR